MASEEAARRVGSGSRVHPCAPRARSRSRRGRPRARRRARRHGPRARGRRPVVAAQPGLGREKCNSATRTSPATCSSSRARRATRPSSPSTSGRAPRRANASCPLRTASSLVKPARCSSPATTASSSCPIPARRTFGLPGSRSRTSLQSSASRAARCGPRVNAWGAPRAAPSSCRPRSAIMFIRWRCRGAASSPRRGSGSRLETRTMRASSTCCPPARPPG